MSGSASTLAGRGGGKRKASTALEDSLAARVLLIGAALAATRGNQIRAAELLGVNRNTLRKKVKDLDLQVIRTAR